MRGVRADDRVEGHPPVPDRLPPLQSRHRAALGHPGAFLVGHGLGEDFFVKYSHGSVTEPHNLYLYAIFSGGLVCFLILLILYWMAIKGIFHNWCQDLGPFMAAILLFIITFNFFDSRIFRR